MKKIILITLFACISIFAFAQEEVVSEEKSSAWVKITIPSATTRVSSTPRKSITPTKKKAVVKTPVSTPAKPPDEFSNTNKKVNRFKKN